MHSGLLIDDGRRAGGITNIIRSVRMEEVRPRRTFIEEEGKGVST